MLDGEQSGFDESGHPVPTVGPAVYDDSPGADAADHTAVRQEVVVRLLSLLTDGNASPEQVGRRALLLAFALGKGPHETQRQLAARLGVTPARACQLLNAFHAKMADILHDS